MLLAVASVSFVGVGMVTAILPLVSPEKGAQLGFIAQGLLLVVSGVYYPVDVMPGWMQWLADDLAGHLRAARHPRRVLDGAGLGDVWGDLWPLLAARARSRSRSGSRVFRAGERYAKRNGKLKRSG